MKRLAPLAGVLALLAACSTASPTATPTRPPAPTAASAAPTKPAAAIAAGAAPTTVAGAPAAANPGGKPVTKRYPNPPEMTIDQNKDYRATITTSMGTIQAQLFAKEAPTTVNNFVFLAREGFYNGVKFHRVIKGFMVQTGDPDGTGAGGPGYRFKDELEASRARGYKKGTLAMANAGPNTNGSQFFIMDNDYPLPPNYSVFGQVTEGIEVVNKIAAVATRPQPSGSENSAPTTEIRIETVTIQEK